MSYLVKKYPHGTFSWADVYSTDITKSKTFLENLFGWTSKDIPTGEGMPDYTMFYLNDHPVAGGSPVWMPQMPSFWSNNISVDDLDQTISQAELLGAKIVMPAADVMDAGRMGTIIDTVGATITFWQPKNHQGAGIVNTAGAMCWNELNTYEPETAQDFYGKLLGWTFSTDDSNYTTIFNHGRANGGIFKLTPEMGDFPACWTPYFTVQDINQTVQKVNQLGGKVLLDIKESGPGKLTMISDPTGASFMIIEMSAEPEHWIE